MGYVFRVTGRVVKLDERSGIKQSTDANGVVTERAWGFHIIRVLVADLDIVEVQRFKDNATPLPAVGDEIDYAVTVDSYKGKVSAQLDQPWAQLVPAKQLTAVPAAGRSAV